MYIRLTKEQQQGMIADIQKFFFNERDEDITEFEAERVLDFVKNSLAPHIYNVAVSDAKYIIDQQFATLEDEIASLERPINNK